jgi:hypothetical protein
VRADIANDLPRPRREALRGDPRFGELAEHIWSLIRDEARQAVGGLKPTTLQEETSA